MQRCTIRSYTSRINYIKKRKRNTPTIGSIASSDVSKRLFEYASQFDPIFENPTIKDIVPYEHEKSQICWYNY